MGCVVWVNNRQSPEVKFPSPGLHPDGFATSHHVHVLLLSLY